MGTTMVPPSQRVAALAEANRIKRERGTLMKRLKAMQFGPALLWVADAIEDTPDCLLGMDVFTLVRSVKCLSDKTVDLMLDGSRIVGCPLLRELTPVRRELLADALRAHAEAWARHGFRPKGAN